MKAVSGIYKSILRVAREEGRVYCKEQSLTLRENGTFLYRQQENDGHGLPAHTEAGQGTWHFEPKHNRILCVEESFEYPALPNRILTVEPKKTIHFGMEPSDEQPLEYYGLCPLDHR